MNAEKKHKCTIGELELKVANLQKDIEYTTKANELQAKETERRLSELNSLERKKEEELQRIQSSYLLKEVYEANHKELVVRVENLREIQFENKGKGEGLSLGWKVLVGAIGFISTLALLINAIRLFVIKQ